MQITGTLELDPKVVATGKDRTRIIRRHSQTIAALVRPYRSHLQGPQRRRANQLDELLFNDPNYWIRRKGAVSEARKLENLLDHARHIIRECKEYPDFKKMLATTLHQLDEDLILTRKNEGWAILRVDLTHILPYLQKIRKEGKKISASAWGPHISVIRGEVRRWTTTKRYCLDGKKYTVEVASEIRKNRSGYYWLDCKSKELENLRIRLDLPPRPSPPFHLTIGKQC